LVYEARRMAWYGQRKQREPRLVSGGVPRAARQFEPPAHYAEGVAQQLVEIRRVDRAHDEQLEQRGRLQRQARLLAWSGIAWHFIEFGIALGAGVAASSIALIGFGADSLIESLAGFVVVWLFTGRRLHSPTAERQAQQLIAASFFVLAAYVGVESIRTLVEGQHPETSWVGIGLAAFTAPTMPVLALAKRRIGSKLHSSATVKEGAQNMLCAYLSVALLAGLLGNAVAGWWWADPAAALVIAAVALREGRESWRGEGCCDAC
jgi:divalent metal cation (Fe/Co/Zn/Cd) transporter